MGKFLDTFFSVVAIPPALAPSVISSHRARYAESLARNHSLGSTALPLLSAKISAQARAELVRARDPGILDAILSSKENRDIVLMSVLDYWTLCEPDQLRLVSRPLPQNTANRILVGPYAPLAKQLAAPYASPGARLEWLSDLGASDADLFAHLEELAPAILGRSPWPIIPLLIERRALRRLALCSDHDALKLVACWTELDASDQNYALEYATRRHLYGAVNDPVVGLLAQPALRTDLRKRLTAFQRIQRDMLGRTEQRSISTATLWPYSFPEVAAPLALRDDPQDLNNLLSQAARMMKFTSNPQDQVGSASIYHELSFNPHLSQDQLERLATGICFHPSMMFDSRSRHLEKDLLRVTTRIDPSVPASSVIERLGLARASAVLRDPLVLDAQLVAPDASIPRAGLHDKWYYYEESNDSASALLELSPAALSSPSPATVGAVEKLSPSFTELLGDASSPLSVRAWTLFLGLCDDDPDVALSAIIQSALRLTHAETISTQSNSA